mmetsp:Transcript_30759/g.80520  ORF Transcript_30759/g.80520 Transcript_30759/m.80520 type:complete len:271 (-) Transcript_30759:2213-3025(-)
MSSVLGSGTSCSSTASTSSDSPSSSTSDVSTALGSCSKKVDMDSIGVSNLSFNGIKKASFLNSTPFASVCKIFEMRMRDLLPSGVGLKLIKPNPSGAVITGTRKRRKMKPATTVVCAPLKRSLTASTSREETWRKPAGNSSTLRMMASSIDPVTSSSFCLCAFTSMDGSSLLVSTSKFIGLDGSQISDSIGPSMDVINSVPSTLAKAVSILVAGEFLRKSVPSDRVFTTSSLIKLLRRAYACEMPNTFSTRMRGRVTLSMVDASKHSKKD